MNENRHRTVSLMNDIHPEYVVNVAFGGAKDGIDGKIGKDGEPGKDGAPGEDGFSPIVEAFRNPEDTGIIVRVTDKDGTRETYVQDGTSSTSDRSEIFNQRLDDVLRFRNTVTGDLGYTTDTSIRATDIEMSTDGDKPGKISLEAAETSNGQTRIQSGKIWLGDYNSSGDYEKLITLDAINNNWRTYQTIIENGELSLKDLDRGYRTIVISGTSSKPYIDMRSDSNSSTHSIKLQVNGDKGSTNILNGQIVLKDESGNKQIDISSRTNGKGIVKLSDKKLLESTKINNTNVVKLFTTDGTNLFTIDNSSICYGNSLLNPFIGVYNIDTTIPVLPSNPSISVDDSDFYPTGTVDISNPNGDSIVWAGLNRYSGTRYGIQGLTSSVTTAIQCYGNDIVYSNRHFFAYEDNGSYTAVDTDYTTSINNSGYADLLSATVTRTQEFDGKNDTGLVELRDAMGNDVLYVSTENDDNDYQYTSVRLYIDGGADNAHIDGDVLTKDDRILLGDHKLSDIVTYNETFTNSGSTLQLKNNTIYTANGDISNKSFSYSGGDCIIEFSTVGTGSVTMHFPMTITFDEWPTFGNDEHWIIGIRDGWAVWTMHDLSQ